jgi:aminoglycoside phosphotransferase (APT) family kinase protein
MVDGCDVVLMEDVGGISLKKALRGAKTQSEAKKIVRLAASALAALHTFQSTSRRVRTFDTYVEFLRGEAAGVQLVAPLLAQQALALLRRVSRLHLPACGAPSFIHGDFAPSQLLVLGGRVAVVDFDNACLGDPAADAGNFMAKLHRRAVSKGRYDHRQLSQAFLREYQEQTGDGALEERARAYQVLTLVRTAIHTFRRAPRSYGRDGPASLPVMLLEEAAECLAAL